MYKGISHHTHSCKISTTGTLALIFDLQFVSWWNFNVIHHREWSQHTTTLYRTLICWMNLANEITILFYAWYLEYSECLHLLNIFFKALFFATVCIVVISKSFRDSLIFENVKCMHLKTQTFSVPTHQLQTTIDIKSDDFRLNGACREFSPCIVFMLNNCNAWSLIILKTLPWTM